MSDCLWRHRLCSPWNSPGQNTGVGRFSLPQGISPTQGSNPGLPYCRWILYQLSPKGNLRALEWVTYSFSSGSSWPRSQTGVSYIASRFFTNWTIKVSPNHCKELRNASMSICNDVCKCQVLWRLKSSKLCKMERIIRLSCYLNGRFCESLALMHMWDGLKRTIDFPFTTLPVSGLCIDYFRKHCTMPFFGTHII